MDYFDFSQLEILGKQSKYFRVHSLESWAPSPGPEFSTYIRVCKEPLPYQFEEKIDDLLGGFIGIGFVSARLGLIPYAKSEPDGKSILMKINLCFPGSRHIPKAAFDAMVRLESRIPQLFTADEVTLVPIDQIRKQ